MRKVWKVCHRRDDGTVESACAPYWRDFLPSIAGWVRTYRAADGSRPVVPRALAFARKQDAVSFASKTAEASSELTGSELLFGVYRAEAKHARRIDWIAFGQQFESFQEADGRPNGWSRDDAPEGTLYCHDLRLTGDGPVAVFGE